MNWSKILFALLILTAMQAVEAKTQHALIVGVANYYHLPSHLQLEGPIRDAQIVKKTLLTKGFNEENITELVSSTHKDTDTEPTRDNILSALKALAESSGEGDFVYLHFAGHGSRQPASTKSNDEPDGLDEIFLPADVKKWDKFIGSVVNAITDQEIAVYIDAIRNRGSDVWVVFDSCHSGSMTRGIGHDEVRFRKVVNQDLGIPDLSDLQKDTDKTRSGNDVIQRGKSAVKVEENNFALNSPEQDKTVTQQPNVKKGALIAFSAAQSDQTTPEMKLPRGHADRQFHGLFTYTLMNILLNNYGISYLQLAQQVMANYQSIPWHGTTPLLSATDMSATVFNESEKSVNQWQSVRNGEQVRIPAGMLNKLTEGAIVGLYDSPTAKKAVALATITISTAMQSEGQIENKMSDKDVTIDKLPTTVFARLHVPHAQFQLKVKAVRTHDQSSKSYEHLSRSLLQVAEDNDQLIDVAKDDNLASLFVAQFDKKIWFITPEQQLPCNVQRGLSAQQRKSCQQERKAERLNYLELENDGAIQDVLQRGLLTIAKAHNLIAVQSVLNRKDRSLTLDFLVEKNGVRQARSDISPTLKSGEFVNLAIKNDGARPQNITVLFVDSQYGIQVAHPRPGEPNVLAPKETLELRYGINANTIGHEHLIVLNAPSTGIVQSFNFLEQLPLSVTLRGNGQEKKPVPQKLTPLQKMLNAVQSGIPVSRGLTFSDTKPVPESGLNIFSWQTQP